MYSTSTDHKATIRFRSKIVAHGPSTHIAFGISDCLLALTQAPMSTIQGAVVEVQCDYTFEQVER